VKGIDDTDEWEATDGLLATQLGISENSLLSHSHGPTTGKRGEKREYQDAQTDISTTPSIPSIVTKLAIWTTRIHGLRSGASDGQHRPWLHQLTLDSPAYSLQRLTTRLVTWWPRLTPDIHQ
jgi:hypothetical protein